MNPQEVLFRCSSLGHLMTEPKEKSPFQKWEEASLRIIELQKKYDETKNKETKTAVNLQASIQKAIKIQSELSKTKDSLHISESAKTHIIDVFVSAKYQRREDITSKFLEKGNQREEDAITLFSLSEKGLFHKNTERFSNEYITGEPDLIKGNPPNAEHTIDTKVSWSAHTYFRTINKEINPLYYWQGMGYMALTGAKKHTVAYCLVNGTVDTILYEKYKASIKRDNSSSKTRDEDYEDECRQIEINHIFDLKDFMNEYPHFDFQNDIQNWQYDIPRKERIFTFEIERDEEAIAKIYQRVADARKYLDILNERA